MFSELKDLINNYLDNEIDKDIINFLNININDDKKELIMKKQINFIIKKINDNKTKNKEFIIGCCHCLMADYYENINILKIKYLLLASEAKCNWVFAELGYYYDTYGKFDIALKYYKMGIEKGCLNAMNLIGLYYLDIEKDYNLAWKYLYMAATKGDIAACNNLGLYYREIDKDYEMAKKYYLMAINGRSQDGFKLTYKGAHMNLAYFSANSILFVLY